MRIYSEVFVADSCLVSEAILWLAIGRLPLVHFIEDEDVRDDIKNFEPEGFTGTDDGYSKEEFAAIGADVDYADYEEVRYFHGNPKSLAPELARSAFEAFDKHVAEHGEGDQSHAEALAKFRKLHHAQERAIDEYLLATESPFQWHLESAQILIMGKLFTGELSAIGVKEDEDSELGYGFAEIAKSDWRLSGFDSKTSTLKNGDDTFWMTKVPTTALLSAFPEPSILPIPISANALGRHLIIADTLESSKPNDKRGRPSKKAEAVNLVIKREFERRRKSGELPKKREAATQDAMDWSETILGVKISRSTMQRYLAEVFERMPKIK